MSRKLDEIFKDPALRYKATIYIAAAINLSNAAGVFLVTLIMEESVGKCNHAADCFVHPRFFHV